MNLMDLVMSVVLNDDDARQSLEDLTRQAERTGSTFKAVGANMVKVGAGIAVGVGAIGTAMYSIATDADNANRKIQASLGLTGEQAKAVSDQARDLWKKGFTGSMEEASDAVLAVKLQMSQLNDADLSKITQQAMNIGKNFDEDSAQIARGADTMMKVFGISAEEAMDKITVGFQHGLNYSGEFIDSIAEYSVYFNNMGMSSDDMINVMVAGMENGAFQLDKVGDAIKENFLRLSDMGKGEADAIKQLGLNSQQIMDMINSGGEGAAKAYEMVNVAIAGVKSETDRTAITTALYGTQSEDVGKKVMDAMRSVENVIGDTTGKAQELNETMSNTPAQQMQAQFNTLKDSLVPLATIMMDIASQAMPYVIAGVEKLTGFISSLSPAMQKAVVIGGAIAGAFGVLLVVLAPVISAIGTMIPLFVKVFGVVSKAGTVIGGLATPVGWAIIAITALIAIGVALYKNSEEVRDFVDSAWKAIGNFVKSSIESAGNAVEAGTKWISDKWNESVEFVKGVVNSGFQLIEKYVTDPINSAHEKVTTTLDNVKTKFTNIGSDIKTNVKTAFNEAKDFIVNPIETAKTKIGEAIDEIKGFFSNLKLKIPSIELPKLPKANLGTTTKKIMGQEIEVPSISWNAKGGIFSKPTILNTANAGLQGVGEASPEMIMPLNKSTWDSLATSILDAMGGNAGKSIEINNYVETNKAMNASDLARYQRKQMEQLGQGW
ncbi:MAG: phage tail tape measure protein [Erysipelotrichaceae bacterium]